jgi:hypothetical protein
MMNDAATTSSSVEKKGSPVLMGDKDVYVT